jgi:hypothetical protein
MKETQVAPSAHIAIKKFPLNLNVSRYTTDSNGTVLAPGAVPVSERNPFPFHLFGNFDREGGYAVADNLCADYYNTLLFGVYVWGLNTPLFFFNPAASINSKMKKGDVVFIYVDDLDAPNYFTFVIVSSLYGAYSSLISQTNMVSVDPRGMQTIFRIREIRYSWFDTNDVQLEQPLFIVQTKYDSAVKTDALSPAAYYVPEQKNVKIARIPVDLALNTYMGVSGFLAFENPVLNLSFELTA